MSDRGTFRGRGGRGGGFDRGGGRGAHSTQHRGGGAASGGAAAPQQEKPKKENILDLSKYMDKEVTVKFNGGREGQSGPCLRFVFVPVRCLLELDHGPSTVEPREERGIRKLSYHILFFSLDRSPTSLTANSHRNPQRIRPAHESSP